MAALRGSSLSVLDRAMGRHVDGHRGSDAHAPFERFEEHVTGFVSEGYAAVANDLGLSKGAVKVAAHGMRRRLRELVRKEVADTVGGQAVLDGGRVRPSV